MRPVERPADPNLGVKWHPYGKAQAELIEKLGEYCSYCERRILTGIHIEHIIPKGPFPDFEEKWENFLLACTNCNSPKSDITLVSVILAGKKYCEISKATFCFFPDRQGAVTYERSGDYKQDSFNVFEYREGGLITVNPKVTDTMIKNRVVATLCLFRLDRCGPKDRTISNLHFWSYAAGMGQSAGDPATGAEWDPNLVIAGGLGTCNLLTELKKKNVDTAEVAKGAANVLATFNRKAVKDDGMADYRAIQRHETWELASRYRNKFDRLLGEYKQSVKKGSNTKKYAIPQTEIEARLNRLTKLTIDQAKAIGFWSVWATVFKARPKSTEFENRPAIVPVLDGLLNAKNFPGTRPHTDFAPPLYTVMEKGDWERLFKEGKESSEMAFLLSVVDPKIKDAVEKAVENEKNPFVVGSTGEKLAQWMEAGRKLEVERNDLKHQMQLEEQKNQKQEERIKELTDQLEECNRKGNVLLKLYGQLEEEKKLVAANLVLAGHKEREQNLALDDCQRRLKQCLEERKKIQLELQKAEQENRVLTERLDNSEQANKELAKQNEDLKRKLQRCNEMLEECQKTRQNLELELSEANEARKSLRGKLFKAMEERDRAQEELRLCRNAYQELDMKLKMMSSSAFTPPGFHSGESTPSSSFTSPEPSKKERSDSEDPKTEKEDDTPKKRKIEDDDL